MRRLIKAKLFLLLCFLVPALLLLAACGPSDASEQIAVTANFAGGQMSPTTITAKQGDTVTLKIESDNPGTFHLHGYDLEGESGSGSPAEIQFVADATGRFPLTFHGSTVEAETGMTMPSDGEGITSSESNSAMDHGSADHGPMESTVPVEVEIAAEWDSTGGLHISIETEGWRWAPEEVNGDNSPGAGHAHVYVDGEKVGRIYGSYHYLPSLEPGSHEVRVSLNANEHNELTWQGSPLEASTTVTAPDGGALDDHQMGQTLEAVRSEAPMSLKILAHRDPLGGYNLQVVPNGFEFAQGSRLSHAPGKGHAQVAIDEETVSKLFVPWLKLPAQGEGMHTFTVSLLNNEGKPYHYNGIKVEESTQVYEEAKADDADSDVTGGHDSSDADSTGNQNGDAGGSTGHDSQASAGNHGGDAGSQAGADHHDQSGGGGEDSTELEVGYLEVLPR